MSASAAIAAAAKAALGGMTGVRTFEAGPVQAAMPHIQIETGPERDWSTKSCTGRELRLALIVRDQGESPERLRRIMADAEARIAGMAEALEGWRIVTCLYTGSITARGTKDWTGRADFRVRMLAA